MAGRPSFLLGQSLTHAARRFPDLACFISPDGATRSFAETEVRVNRLSDALRNRGVTNGTRIAMLGVDSFEYMELILASLRLGATYVPLNYRLVPSEIQNLLSRARPALLFVDGRYVEVAREVAAALDTAPEILSIDDSLPDSITSLIEEGRDVEVLNEVADDDIIGIMFTSGTTGEAKGVMQSHAMLKAMLMIGWEVSPRPGDIRYTASPLFHIAGLFIVLTQIAKGATSLIAPQFDPAVTARCINNGMITGCFLVPTMIAGVLDEMGEPDPRQRLRMMMYGSAPMPPSLLRRALERWPDVEFWNLFGPGTEAGIQTYLRPADHRRALAGEEYLLGSVGQPVIGVDVRIFDDEGNECARGEIGHIASRTDAVMSGYLDMPEKSAEALRGEWVYGGDKGYFDKDYYLFLGGRGRDMIIRGGENIYVSEIELVLTEAPGVVDSAVVGREDEFWGEVVVAFVEHGAGTAPTQADLDAVCRERLAGYKVPVEYHVLAKLPRNATGKVAKAELKKLLADAPA